MACGWCCYCRVLNCIVGGYKVGEAEVRGLPNHRVSFLGNIANQKRVSFSRALRNLDLRRDLMTIPELI